MNNNPLLTENESKRLSIRLPLLLCFSLYSSWQMGVVYFSGETLSIDSRTPLPVDVGNLTALIAAGYILSIIVMIALPRIIVWAERITAGLALVSVLALFMPLAPGVLSLFYYVQCFCCLFMIGFESAIIINLFSEKTAIMHLLVAYPFAQVIIAILQNDIVKMPFRVFRLFSVIALAFMVLFFFKLPAKTWPCYVKKEDKFVAPKSFFTGIFILVALDCFATLFGIAVAESVLHGVSVLYLSSTIYGITLYFLWKRFGITPLRSVKWLTAISALGFVMAIVAQYVPALSLPACFLLGAGATCCWLNPFFGILIAKRYPSRFIAPVFIGIAFITVLIHSALLDALRNNLTMLYVVYLFISVVLVIVYLLLEPYLIYSFRGRTLQDIIGVVAEEPTILQTAPQAAPVAEASVQADEPLHAQRMKILLTHVLSPLTRREYQVTDCIMRGLRRSEIAKEMDVLPETITKFTNNIYSKFDIHRRQDLFRLAEKLEREWGV